MSTPDVMLQSALTFRDASRRTVPVSTTFEDPHDAVSTWIDVVLHEANVVMSEPLETRPERPYLHPVDIDTSDPGIVSMRGLYLREAYDAKAEQERLIAALPEHIMRRVYRPSALAYGEVPWWVRGVSREELAGEIMQFVSGASECDGL